MGPCRVINVGVVMIAGPFDRFSIAGRHCGGGPMAFDDEFVDVGGVESVEGLEGEVVDDQQVDAQESAHLDVVTVVEAAGAQAFEHPVAAFEVHGVPTSHGDVAQGRSQEGLDSLGRLTYLDDARVCRIACVPRGRTARGTVRRQRRFLGSPT
jgi:hypothetical protein